MDLGVFFWFWPRTWSPPSPCLPGITCISGVNDLSRWQCGAACPSLGKPQYWPTLLPHWQPAISAHLHINIAQAPGLASAEITAPSVICVLWISGWLAGRPRGYFCSPAPSPPPAHPRSWQGERQPWRCVNASGCQHQEATWMHARGSLGIKQWLLNLVALSAQPRWAVLAGLGAEQCREDTVTAPRGLIPQQRRRERETAQGRWGKRFLGVCSTKLGRSHWYEKSGQNTLSSLSYSGGKTKCAPSNSCTIILYCSFLTWTKPSCESQPKYNFLLISNQHLNAREQEELGRNTKIGALSFFSLKRRRRRGNLINLYKSGWGGVKNTETEVQEIRKYRKFN